MDAPGDVTAVQPKWCVVGNVVHERLRDGQVLHGTKQFSGGAKVYLHSAFWGTGGESVTVVGHARRSGRWVRVTLDARVVENWRATVVHQPVVLRHLADDEVQGDEDTARAVVSALSAVSDERRLRLVERPPQVCLDLAATSPTPTLSAARGIELPPRHGLVLYDGAEAVAGLLYDVHEYGTASGGGLMPWAAVWVVRDRRDTLADLLHLVQRRHRGMEQLWVGDLARRLRQAAASPPADDR